MEQSDSVIEKFHWYSDQMELSCRKQKFDVFRQLSVERFRLLQIPADHPERPSLLKLFQEDTAHWISRLDRLILKKKTEQPHWHAVTRRVGGVRRSGRLINQVG